MYKVFKTKVYFKLFDIWTCKIRSDFYFWIALDICCKNDIASKLKRIYDIGSARLIVLPPFCILNIYLDSYDTDICYRDLSWHVSIKIELCVQLYFLLHYQIVIQCC